MIVTLQTERVQTLADVRAVIDGNDRLDYQFTDRDAACEFIRRTLVRFDYPTLRKPDKGVIGRYLAKKTGLSRAQMTRLVGQHRATGRVTDRRGGRASAPVRATLHRRRHPPAGGGGRRAARAPDRHDAGAAYSGGVYRPGAQWAARGIGTHRGRAGGGGHTAAGVRASGVGGVRVRAGERLARRDDSRTLHTHRVHSRSPAPGRC